MAVPAKPKAPKDKPNYVAYAVVFGIFGMSLIAFCIQVYDSLFPDRPVHIKTGDTDMLNKAFFGGSPAIWMCRNETHAQLDNGRARDAFEGAMKLLKRDGYAAYTLDCDKPLKGEAGPNALQFWKLNAAYQPVWGYVGYGKTPTQMSPQYTSNFDAMAKLVKDNLVNKQMKVANTADLNACVRDRTNGCMLVYTSRNIADVTRDLAPVLGVVPTSKFATLNATSLRLATPGGSVVQRVLASGVKTAKEASLQAGRKGELLVLLKRVSAPGGGSATATASGGNLLVTVGFTANPGVITAADVERLGAKAKKAREASVAVMSEAAAAASASGVELDVVEALLAREEALERLDSALVGLTGDVTVDRLAAPQQQQQKQGQGQHQQARGAERTQQDSDDDKAAQKAAHRMKQAKRKQQEEEQEAVDPAEMERRRRQQMASEEAASAFVAHAAEGSEEEEAQLVDDVLEEEVVDLDSSGDSEDDSEL